MSELRTMLAAALLACGVAAAVAAATVRYGVEAPPRIAGVRLAEITAAYTTRAASEGDSAEDVRAWGEALEAALDRVAARHRLVLLPARAVAAGAPDLTIEVEAALADVLKCHLDELGAMKPDDMVARRWAKYEALGEWTEV